MSPKAMKYRTNSIIYFKDDKSDKIFILNSGQVSLNYIDIETGQDVHELIKTGEFFGVKSSMGGYQREETAVVLQDSMVLAFTVDEFSQLSVKNTRIVLKMLRVFSNQLRRIHKQVQNLLYAEEHINPEVGLYRIGEYYLKTYKYTQAIYALSRYLVYYPSGKYSVAANENLELAEKYLGEYGQGKGQPVGHSGGSQEIEKPIKSRELSDIAKRYYNAVSLVTKQEYQNALDEFKDIIKESVDEEYVPKAWYEVGRCLFFLEQYDNCIRIYSNLIQKYPKHPDLNEVIYFIAKSNEAIGEKRKALGLYRKLISMISESNSLYRKVKEALKTLESMKNDVNF